MNICFRLLASLLCVFSSGLVSADELAPVPALAEEILGVPAPAEAGLGEPLLTEEIIDVTSTPVAVTGSEECDSIEARLEHVNNEIERVKAELAKKELRKAVREQELNSYVKMQMEYIKSGAPTPPGLTDAINDTRAVLDMLDMELKALNQELQGLADENNELWAQYETADC